MVLKICARIPWTIEAIAITVATPITTPRMVSPARSLLARSESSAIRMPSSALRISIPPPRGPVAASFLAQRGDGVEPGGAARGVDAEEHAGAGAEEQGHGHRPGGDPGGEGGERRHGAGAAPP